MNAKGEGTRSILSRIVHRAIIAAYRARGWRIDAPFPHPLKKCVIACAPHTSNWDFAIFAGATHEEGVKPNFMGKHTLFTGVLRDFMFDMGGIPVDRSRRAKYVDQVAREFARREELALVIAVEGSRSSDGQWRSGFYHIAMAAGVPIVPAYADNEKRIAGFGVPIMPSGDYGADLLTLSQLYRTRLPDCERFAVMEAQARQLIANGAGPETPR